MSANVDQLLRLSTLLYWSEHWNPLWFSALARFTLAGVNQALLYVSGFLFWLFQWTRFQSSAHGCGYSLFDLVPMLHQKH